MHTETTKRTNLARTPRALLIGGLLFAACGDPAPKETPAATSEPAAAPAAAPAAPTANERAAPAQPESAKESASNDPLKVVDSFEGGMQAPKAASSAGIEVPPDDPVLGPALVIDGEVVPHHRVRRQVIFGERGQVPLEMKKLEVIMRQEIARRIELGASMDEFAVSDDEVQAEIEEQEQAVRESYPDDDVDLAEVLPIGADGLPDRVMVTKMFTKVFLPDVSPEEYPPITLEALHANEQGAVLLQTMQQEWDARAAGEEPDTNPLFQQMIYQTLREHLLATSTIEEGDHLPADVLMRINGEDVMVSDLWDRIAPQISISDVRSAKQWIVNMTLLEKELADYWLTEEEAAAAYEEHSAPYRDSMFSIETIALMVKKYPNLEAYKQFRRAYDSYQRKIADELNPEDLKAFAQERTLQLVGQGKIDADIILCSAYDFRAKKWKEKGWQKAAECAQEVLRQLVEEKRSWNEVQEEFSDFYDPPIPANFVGDVQRLAKGRFRAQTRNQLMQLLEESEYWQFLNGQTITDFIFFEQEPGSVAQPMRGPRGWYIPRLIRRTTAPENINLTEENIILMAEQDYTLQSLSAFIQEIIARHDVYGLE